jgi:RHS repeat-associated protein
LIGRVDITTSGTGTTIERLYYVKDHPPRRAGLGSTRVTISGTNTANNNIIFASDYYPFGETLREYTTGTNKYKFTEKERDAESSYDYFGARYYNNKLGVWLSADPLADKYPGFNPFNYCVNNPLRLVDPVGMEYTEADRKRDEQVQNSFEALGGFNIDGPEGEKKGGSKKVSELPKFDISDPWLASGQFYSYSSSLTAVECWAIETGKNAYTKDDEERIKSSTFDLILWALPLGEYKAVGSLKNWLRIGKSYSQVGLLDTWSIRWGSNLRYQKEIGSATARWFNSIIHEAQIPINSWRTADRGHLHILKQINNKWVF